MSRREAGEQARASPETGARPVDERAAGGSVLRLESAFRTAGGIPRFEMLIPHALMHDPGVYHLQCQEVEFGGYERATRSLLDARLKPGDAFIDVGAHFGVFSLQAATLHADRVAVLAIEPHPENVRELRRNLAHNDLLDAVEVVAAAASDSNGPGHLARNSTMGYHLFPTYSPGSKRVQRRTIDALLAERPRYRGRRSWLKIDVEGHELQVIRGARELLSTGHVAGIVWEKGYGYESATGQALLRELLSSLNRLGYRHYRFESELGGGRLRPFEASEGWCNVISLSPLEESPEESTGGSAVPDPPAEAPLVTVEAKHGTFVCNRFDTIVGRSLRRYGEFAELELERLRPVVRSGDTVLDVGANVGSHSLAFSAFVGPEGRVLAFEPQPEIHQLLESNVRRNARANVTTHPVAVGDREGTLYLPELRLDSPGNFGHVGLVTRENPRPVACITLDSLLPLPGVSLIKADVEGMELEVLIGASRLIAAQRPVLYVENDRRDRSAALIAHLLALEYAVYWHTPRLFNPSNHAGETRDFFGRLGSFNMLCLPRERGASVSDLRPVETPEDRP